jgi:hypothetical protein
MDLSLTFPQLSIADHLRLHRDKSWRLHFRGKLGKFWFKFGLIKFYQKFACLKTLVIIFWRHKRIHPKNQKSYKVEREDRVGERKKRKVIIQ